MWTFLHQALLIGQFNHACLPVSWSSPAIFSLRAQSTIADEVRSHTMCRCLGFHSCTNVNNDGRVAATGVVSQEWATACGNGDMTMTQLTIRQHVQSCLFDDDDCAKMAETNSEQQQLAKERASVNHTILSAKVKWAMAEASKRAAAENTLEACTEHTPEDDILDINDKFQRNLTRMQFEDSGAMEDSNNAPPMTVVETQVQPMTVSGK